MTEHAGPPGAPEPTADPSGDARRPGRRDVIGLLVAVVAFAVAVGVGVGPRDASRRRAGLLAHTAGEAATVEGGGGIGGEGGVHAVLRVEEAGTHAEPRQSAEKALAQAEPLRCAAALSDGETIHAVRWASDNKPPSLYVCQRGDSVVVASEPVDAARDCWQPLADNTLVTVNAGAVAIAPFEVAVAAAA